MSALLTACGGGGGDTGGVTTPPPVQVGSVSVALPVGTLQVGASATATAEVRSTTGTVLAGRTVVWLSSNTAIASVTDAGVITGVAPGTATITATSEGRTGSATLAVVPAPVSSVSLSLATPLVLVGRTTQASVVLRDERNVTLTGRPVTWASSNAAVASVDANGLVTGVASGTAIISATSEGKSATAEVRVVPPPVSSVTVTLAQATVFQGATTTATAVLRDDLGTVLTGRDIVWTSSNPQVATVNNGAITAVSVGTTTISAASEGRSGSVQLTVVPVPVATVQLTLPRSSVAPGATLQAVATPRDANGNALSGRAVQWGTTNPSVATISTTGQIAAVGIGTAIITATSEGQTGQATLQVSVPVASVVISGSTRVKVGDSYTYAATARAADGTILDRPVTWRVRETTRAQMSLGGTLVPLQSGSFTIVAQIDGSEWDATYSAYDWVTLSGEGTTFEYVDADNRLSNRLGTLEYSQLVVTCSSTGSFVVWVRTPHIITQNGIVAFSFDGSASVAETWTELSPDYTSLWKQGGNTASKNFALQVAASRRLSFAFGEFVSNITKVAQFRVTGFSPRLATLLARCPAGLKAAATDGSSAPAPADEERKLQALFASRRGATSFMAPSPDALLRDAQGQASGTSRVLSSWPTWSAPETTVARRSTTGG